MHLPHPGRFRRLAAMPFSSDTGPEARRVVVEALRRMTPQERLARGFAMTRTLVTLTKAGVLRDLPHASDEDRHREFLRRWLGAPLAERVIVSRRHFRTSSVPRDDR